MPFWTYAERVEALTPPYRLKNNYRGRTKWEAERREELGFTAGGYDQGFEFSHAMSKGKARWLLVDRARHCEITRALPKPGEGREDLVWSVDYHSAGEVASGQADSLEEAWAAACGVAGTDRLELGRAARVNWLRQARHKLKEFDRLAALQPGEAQAQPQRFVYAEESYDRIYDWSEEARAYRNRFRYRRFKLVKETAKFYFCDLENGQTIDRDGAVDDSWEPYIRRDPTLTRIPKALWEEPGTDYWGEPTNTASRYVRNAPYGVSWIWLELEDLVREVAARERDHLRELADPLIHGPWMVVLGLNDLLKDRVVSSITPAELQKAYRRAVKRAHPDTGGSAEAFQAVQEAHAQAQRVFAGIW